MNVIHIIRGELVGILKNFIKEGRLPKEAPLDRITIDAPRDPNHGDLATNAAIVLAKSGGLTPMDLGKLIAIQLEEHPDIQEVSVVQPGFINIRLYPAFWQRCLSHILYTKESYGEGRMGKGKKVNVEYVSANPTGPLHAGHARNAVLGDAIASLLEKNGFDVCREYYVNDAGSQVAALARSVYLRYLEALGHSIPQNAFDGDLYPGDYLIPLGIELSKKYGNEWVDKPESVWLETIRSYAVDAMLTSIKSDLDVLGIQMDVFTSEKKLTTDGKMQEAIEMLKKEGDIYRGTLPPPKGHLAEDWEPREQLLFKATKYGDDTDRALQKSDGSYTYFGGDVAYHYDKYTRGFDRLIDILGADHAGYVKRIKAAALASCQSKIAVDVVVSQMVRLMDKGEPVRMSKRSGHFITLRDIVDRVGKDVVRFIMLTRRNDVGIDFDFDHVVQKTKDNPVFYVQYAHARCHSVLRHALELFGPLEDEDLSTHIPLLTDPKELEILKALALYPHVIEMAALHCEPHRVAYYLYDLASSFHALWALGKEHTHLRFLEPTQRDYSFSKLALIKGVAFVVASGLMLFKVTPLEEMV